MKKFTKSALLISVLISAGVAFSADTYKNSILDMSMKKELNNTVSLTFFTSKPYNENLFITKRNATTYVILFPETNTDIKTEISKVATEGLVQKVDVKTQPYNDQNGKGYTKVVLTTPENTTVLAKTEVYNPEAKAKKMAEAMLPPVIKEPVRSETKAQTQEKQLPPPIKAEQKTSPKKEQTPQKFDIIKPENLPKADANKVAALPDVIKKEEVKEVKEEDKAQDVKNEEPSKLNEDMPLQETETKTADLPQPPVNEKKIQKSELTLFFESKEFWGSAIAVFLLIFAALYIKTKKKLREIIGEDGVDLDLVKVTPKEQEEVLPSKQETSDEDTESKVNLYRLLNSSETAEEDNAEEVTDTYSDDLANLLDVDAAVPENTEEELSVQTPEEDIVFDNMTVDETADLPETDENSDVETEFVLDDIVIENPVDEEKEDDLFELEPEMTEEIPEESTVEPENAIDDYMKYLADNPEKLEVSDISVPEEKEETVPLYEKEETEENTEPEISISDMTNEEISLLESEQNKLQELYHEAVPQEFELQKPEEEEIKIAPDEFEQTDANSMFEREDFASDIMQADEEDVPVQADAQDYEEVSDNEPIFDNENKVLDLTDYKQTVKIHQPVNSSDEEEIPENVVVDYAEEQENAETEDNSVLLENGLKVVSQVQIKKNAGLYMVDYDGSISLIGFKNDNYYVLKNFDEVPSKELQARLYDKTGQKEQYLVKLGREKMIVEFNRKEIKHVMDL